MKQGVWDWEVILAGAIVILLTILVLWVFALGVARAGGCLSMEVPSQAVLHNYDGDTFTVFSMQPGGSVKIRVEGVDTPEITKKEPGSIEAKEFTRQWLSKGAFQLETCGKATLDRIVAKVSRNGRTLAQDLIAAGLTK